MGWPLPPVGAKVQAKLLVLLPPTLLTGPLTGRLTGPLTGRLTGLASKLAVGTCVPCQPEPAQIRQACCREFPGGTGGVGVFEAQHKTTAGLLGEQPVEQGRARVA
jgi:hypothetical protein